ncbi:hypothetical protein [Methylomagnum ishizawai]|uniref:hypothetical protein n=1 Tax=Methylomagnum ishizawai TaxID=1760988 RepID=UPI001C802259|nr:hypothetical protein [Methylomagnum ishizawai]
MNPDCQSEARCKRFGWSGWPWFKNHDFHSCLAVGLSLIPATAIFNTLRGRCFQQSILVGFLWLGMPRLMVHLGWVGLLLSWVGGVDESHGGFYVGELRNKPDRKNFNQKTMICARPCDLLGLEPL